MGRSGWLIAVKLPGGSLLTGTAAGIMAVSAVCRMLTLWWEGSPGLLWMVACCGGGSAAALSVLRHFAAAADSSQADAKKDEDLQGVVIALLAHSLLSECTTE